MTATGKPARVYAVAEAAERRADPARPPVAAPAPTARTAPVPGGELRRQLDLRIGSADDPLEAAADHAAETVVRGGTACGCTGGDCGGTCTVRRAATPGAAVTAGAAPASVGAALARPGAPLDAAVRARLERGFGADLSSVRVRDDAGSTADVGAAAYTVGEEVVFAPGRYAPGTPAGERLLAHELAHVLQQRSGAGPVVRRQQQATQERFCPDTPVDDAQVQRHVDEALRFARTSPTGPSDLNMAFARLRSRREQNCCDVNLAAAEHYMWSRREVADGTWSFFMIMLVLMYDAVKLIRLVPRTGDCPITRASAAQIRWATQGAVDGEMDYYSRGP